MCCGKMKLELLKGLIKFFGSFERYFLFGQPCMMCVNRSKVIDEFSRVVREPKRILNSSTTFVSQENVEKYKDGQRAPCYLSNELKSQQ